VCACVFACARLSFYLLSKEMTKRETRSRSQAVSRCTLESTSLFVGGCWKARMPPPWCRVSRFCCQQCIPFDPVKRKQCACACVGWLGFGSLFLSGVFSPRATHSIGFCQSEEDLHLGNACEFAVWFFNRNSLFVCTLCADISYFLANNSRLFGGLE
jgi:hypothetical protein